MFFSSRSALQQTGQKTYSLKKERFTGIKNLTIITPSERLADIVNRLF
ncbi:MAG: hypothetical protein ACI4RV_04505 [Eubacteriales bacterium]